MIALPTGYGTAESVEALPSQLVTVLTNVDEAIDPALGNSETGATPLGVWTGAEAAVVLTLFGSPAGMLSDEVADGPDGTAEAEGPAGGTAPEVVRPCSAGTEVTDVVGARSAEPEIVVVGTGSVVPETTYVVGTDPAGSEATDVVGAGSDVTEITEVVGAGSVATEVVGIGAVVAVTTTVAPVETDALWS